MRCFISIPLPPEVVSGLTERLQVQDYPPRIRIIPRDLWHVTLVFLGDITDTDEDLMVSACDQLTKRPGSLTMNALTTFPEGKPSLLVATGLGEPKDAWAKFVEDIRIALMPFCPTLDRKPWTPHITLGRGPKDSLLPRMSESAGPWTWKPEGFSLMQSTLGPEGPTYTTLHEFKFI